MDRARRGLLLGLVAAAGLPARAQTVDVRPIRIVVPFATGGGNDVFARQMAKGLGEVRKAGVIVDNKPGAGGNLGTEQVVRSAPDGGTLLLGHTGTVSINPALYKVQGPEVRRAQGPDAGGDVRVVRSRARGARRIEGAQRGRPRRRGQGPAGPARLRLQRQWYRRPPDR